MRQHEIGDHVSWNSDAGLVRGKIARFIAAISNEEIGGVADQVQCRSANRGGRLIGLAKPGSLKSARANPRPPHTGGSACLCHPRSCGRRRWWLQTIAAAGLLTDVVVQPPSGPVARRAAAARAAARRDPRILDSRFVMIFPDERRVCWQRAGRCGSALAPIAAGLAASFAVICWPAESPGAAEAYPVRRDLRPERCLVEPSARAVAPPLPSPCLSFPRSS